MLRSSLTGNALSIRWDIGTDRNYTYEELVEMLQNRYVSKGQAETFGMQLKTSKERRDPQHTDARHQKTNCTGIPRSSIGSN